MLLEYAQPLWATIQAFLTRRLPLWRSRLASAAQKLVNSVTTTFGSTHRHNESKITLYPYQYKPSSGSRNIRLARVKDLPPFPPRGSIGVELGELQYTLEEFQLDKAPPFEALSYRWDSEGPMDMMLIDDQMALQVSVSLKETLFHLSKTRPIESYYWIDAICINQKDIQERNTQVSLMCDVYRTAEGTVVWLGEAFENDSFAIDICAGVDSKSFSINFVASDTARATDNPLHPRRPPDHWLSDIYSLGTTLECVLARPWFSRVWVIQEIALAKAIVVECANGSLPWDYLVQATRMQANAQKDHQRSVYDRALRIMEARDLFKNGTLGFADVLLLSRTFNATDARDRVYGLLGLNTEFAAIVGRPDYGKSIKEVFTDASRAFLSKLSIKGLYLMSSALPRDQIPEPLPSEEPTPTWLMEMDRVAMIYSPGRIPVAPNRPSWVADLEDHPVAWPMDRREVENMFGIPEFHVDGSCLKIKGAIIDKVEAVSNWGKTSGNNRQMWLTWNQWIQESGITNAENSPLGEAQARHICEDGHSQALAVWRTMACDLDNQMVDGEDLFFWHHWFENELAMNVLLVDSRLMTDRDNECHHIGDLQISVAKLRNSTRHKILFSTELGSKFGLGLNKVRQGDFVAFFAGYNVPFLLRPILPPVPRWRFSIFRGTTRAPNLPRYQLLGPCFIHGLMNREQCDWSTLKWSDLLLV